MGATIRSSAYVVGLSLTAKAKQALMHAAEVGKETDESEVANVICGLCEEFLSDTPDWETFVVSELVACVPHVDAGHAMLMLVCEAVKTTTQMQGIVNKWFLQYDALVVIGSRSMAEGALKRTDEATRYLYERLFAGAVSPRSYCDVLLNNWR